MMKITAPTDFARIMKCGDCAEREMGENPRPNYAHNNYSGVQSSYSGNNSGYSASAARYS